MKALVLKSLLVISMVAVTAMAWAKTNEPCSAGDTEWTGSLCNVNEPGLSAGSNKAPADAEGGTGGIVCRECEEAKKQAQVALLDSTNPTPRTNVPLNAKPGRR